MFTKILEKKNVIFINFSNFLFLRKQRDVLSDGIIEQKNKVTNSRLLDEIDHKWGQIFVIFQQLH